MSSAPKWTPGPWEVSTVLDEVDQIERLVVQRPGVGFLHGSKHICQINTWGGSPDPEADANARLIAAAPRMAEALRLFLDIYPEKARAHPDVRIACEAAGAALREAGIEP